MKYFRNFLWIICIFLGYTNLGIDIGSTYVGGILGLVLTFVLILTSRRGSELLLADLPLRVIIFSALFLYAFIISGRFLANARSYGLLGVSFIVYFGLYSLILAELRTRLQSMRFLIGASACLFLVMAGLEVGVSNIKIFSDIFREFAFSGAYLYDSLARDLDLSGIERPKLFTQEPSHLAKALGFLFFAVFAAAPSRKTFFVSIIGCAFSYFLTRSPTVLFGFLIALVLAVNLVAPTGIRSLLNAGVAVLILLGVTAIPSIAQHLSTFSVRAALIAEYSDSSAIERFFAPARLATQILSDSPLLGIGLGNKEIYIEEVISAYAKFSHYEFSRLYFDQDLSFGWYNAFFEGASCLGIIGMAATFILVQRLIPPIDRASVYPIFLIVSMADSGFPSPRLWLYVFVYLSFFQSAIERSRLEKPF